MRGLVSRAVDALRAIDEWNAGVAAAGSNTTLEQIFLSIVGQDGAKQPQMEELSWLM